MTAAEHPAAHPAGQPPARATGGGPRPAGGGPPAAAPVPERPPAHSAADARHPTADGRQPPPEGAPAEARPPTAAGPSTSAYAGPPTAARPPTSAYAGPPTAAGPSTGAEARPPTAAGPPTTPEARPPTAARHPTAPEARPPTAARPPGGPADGRHRAVAAARARVRDLLRTRAAGPVPPRVEDDVLLVVTELVTNAVRHGGGVTAFHAELDGDGGDLTVEVTDASPAPPRTRPHGDDRAAAPGGFGWPLVRRLSHRVAVTPAPGGKTVRAVLRLGPGA